MIDVSDLRIGVLGAARIAPLAIVRPARDVSGATVTAIAARDPERARAFASKHEIPRVHTSYDDLVDDPEVDAVYIPLPNGLHAEWTMRAIAAGKHVLCEKPFTANAVEAVKVADAADASDVVVMEAFHYRYHALAQRMYEITHDGTIGDVQRVRTWLCFPLPKFSDIRYNYSLAGGASMDCCYPVHALRLLGPGAPEVVSAHAKTLRRDPRVDRAMTAHFQFPTGATGVSEASMWSRRLLRVAADVEGTRGRMRVLNFVAPQIYNRLKVTVDGKPLVRERVRGDFSYVAQLKAFVAAVRDGAPFPTTPRDAVVTMQLVDDIYRAAGLPLRGV